MIPYDVFQRPPLVCHGSCSSCTQPPVKSVGCSDLPPRVAIRAAIEQERLVFLVDLGPSSC